MTASDSAIATSVLPEGSSSTVGTNKSVGGNFSRMTRAKLETPRRPPAAVALPILTEGVAAVRPLRPPRPDPTP